MGTSRPLFLAFLLIAGIAACRKAERQVDYFKDGGVKLVQECKDGRPHGRTSGYFLNGKKAFAQEYRMGRPHGKLTLWYPDGRIRTEGLYRDGERHGLWVDYHENGRKKNAREYKDGLLHGALYEWDPDGNLSRSELYRDGYYERPRVAGDFLGQGPPGARPEIFAPGVVSTEEYPEIGCTFSPDGREFYFTRLEGGSLDDRRTIRFMRREDGGDRWTVPRPAPFSGRWDDIEPMFAPDGKRLFFGSDRPLDGQGEQKDTDVWFVERTAAGWSVPRNAGPAINTANREFHASATRDGTLYFAGVERDGGDIYRSRLQAGAYSPRELLPRVINSDDQETHPYIAPDESYLIFERGPRLDVQGQYGLFISFRTPGDAWSRPRHLGEAMNGGSRAGFPAMSPDGKYLFFARDGDIYWVSRKALELARENELP